LPITAGSFGEEALWRNRVSAYVPMPEWNRETYGYRDVLTFLPSNQSENVIIRFSGMGYRRPSGQPVYYDLITFRGNTGFLYGGQIAFHARIKPGVPLRLSASDFTWPAHSFTNSHYGSATKNKARVLWFNSVQFIPE
jgi:hypothetical protein